MLPALLDVTPAATATGPDGRLWFSSSQTALLGYVYPGGQVKEFLPPTPSLGPALGIAVGSDGDLWFIEGSASNRIGRIDPQGNFNDFPVPSGQAAQSIAAGPDGNIWFTEQNGIGWIDTTTGIVREFQIQFPANARVSFDANGTPLLTTEGSVSSLTSTTVIGLANQNLVASFETIQQGAPAITWFIEPGNTAIGRFDQSGDFTVFPVPSGAKVLQIAVGPDGNIWFTEQNGIGWFNPSTGVISEVGIDPAASTTRFSLAADGTPLLTVGQAVEKLNSDTILALVNQNLSDGSELPTALLSSYSAAVANASTTTPVFSSWQVITFMISLPSPAPPAAGHPSGQSTPGTGNANGASTSGVVLAFFAFAVPTHATDQVAWASLADHGVPGQEASNPISAVGISGLAVGTSTISPSLPAAAASFEAVRFSGTAEISAAIDDEINSKSFKVWLDANAEFASACQIWGALATADESCQISKPVTDEEVRGLAHSSAVDAPARVPRELLATTLASPWETRAVQDTKTLASILPALQGLQTRSVPAPPDRNALLAIAGEYRHRALPVSPPRANTTSKPRTLLTRIATAWFVLQSVTIGIGRVVRKIDPGASHHPTKPAQRD